MPYGSCMLSMNASVCLYHGMDMDLGDFTSQLLLHICILIIGEVLYEQNERMFVDWEIGHGRLASGSDWPGVGDIWKKDTFCDGFDLHSSSRELLDATLNS